jgi:hypothetical protein
LFNNKSDKAMVVNLVEQAAEQPAKRQTASRLSENRCYQDGIGPMSMRTAAAKFASSRIRTRAAAS